MSLPVHIGALIIRIGFWRPLYYNYSKEPPKIVSVIMKPPVVAALTARGYSFVIPSISNVGNQNPNTCTPLPNPELLNIRDLDASDATHWSRARAKTSTFPYITILGELCILKDALGTGAEAICCLITGIPNSPRVDNVHRFIDLKAQSM